MSDERLTQVEAEALWSSASEVLAGYVPPSTYDLWFRPLRPVCATGSTLNLTGPAHVRAWVERRYPDLITSALRSLDCPLDSVRLIDAADPAELAAAGEAPSSAELNPSYSFGHFVIGPGNQLAHAAALAVAEAPGQAYNPLFLHGPPGLGKTHLMGAIANHIASHSPHLRIRYATAELFTSEFVRSLHAGEIDEFKRRHRELDVLLLDDVQFLEGKQRTADELFHTFNTLFDSGAQVVLSADRMPSELSLLADRLRDRFEWGLIADIHTTDPPTRAAIVRHLARLRGEILDDDCVRAVAERAPANVRALEGALTRVLAIASLTGSPVNPEVVAQALPGGEPAPPPAAPVTAGRVQRLVAERCGVSPDSLLSSNRSGPVARARQLAMYLTREHTDLSLPAIAESFRRRNHTTVLYALRQVEGKLGDDRALAELVAELGAELTGDAAAANGS